MTKAEGRSTAAMQDIFSLHTRSTIDNTHGLVSPSYLDSSYKIILTFYVYQYTHTLYLACSPFHTPFKTEVNTLLLRRPGQPVLCFGKDFLSSLAAHRDFKMK